MAASKAVVAAAAVHSRKEGSKGTHWVDTFHTEGRSLAAAAEFHETAVLVEEDIAIATVDTVAGVDMGVDTGDKGNAVDDVVVVVIPDIAASLIADTDAVAPGFVAVDLECKNRTVAGNGDRNYCLGTHCCCHHWSVLSMLQVDYWFPSPPRTLQFPTRRH